MKVLLQRVKYAHIEIDQVKTSEIKKGILAMVGFEPSDHQQTIQQMLQKILHYRIFDDDAGKMNKNIQEIDASLLLVPQFTLAANTHKGLRPSFSSACPPEQAAKLFDSLVQHAKTLYRHIEQGTFGADMAVTLCNDGPVTFLITI